MNQKYKNLVTFFLSDFIFVNGALFIVLNKFSLIKLYKLSPLIYPLYIAIIIVAISEVQIIIDAYNLFIKKKIGYYTSIASNIIKDKNISQEIIDDAIFQDLKSIFTDDYIYKLLFFISFLFLNGTVSIFGLFKRLCQ